MFNIFKKKSEKEILQNKYRKLMEEALCFDSLWLQENREIQGAFSY